MQTITSSRIRRTLAIAGLGAALYGLGHYQGAKQASSLRELEQISTLPAAKSFLDAPTTYQLSIRTNRHAEREAYLRNTKEGTELRLPEATPRLLNASNQNL